MRVVLDTNIIVSGLLWNGSQRRLITEPLVNQLSIFTSEEILAELTNTLSYKKLAQVLAASRQTVPELVKSYRELSTSVMSRKIPRTAPDPDDDIILGTALAAQATYLITGDKPFLSVGSFQSVQLVTVTQFLDILTTPSPTTE